MRQFTRDADTPVLLMHASCLGVDLAAATHLFVLDVAWDGTWAPQTLQAAYRLAQSQAVHVWRYVWKGAIIILYSYSCTCMRTHPWTCVNAIAASKPHRSVHCCRDAPVATAEQCNCCGSRRTAAECPVRHAQVLSRAACARNYSSAPLLPPVPAPCYCA